MKLLLIFVIGFLGSLVNNYGVSSTEICTKGIDQVIYDDQLGYTVSDWSWAKPRNFSNFKPVHSGSHSISFVPKTYEAIYLNLQNPIDPSIISSVSFWVHGNKVGNQKIIVRFTSNKVAVSRDFFLWGEESVILADPSVSSKALSKNIQGGKWVNAVINCDKLEPGQYDGIQIAASGEDIQEMVFIDDIEVNKRCISTNPYRNLMKPVTCDGHDCIVINVTETSNQMRWFANEVEYQKYTVTMKNTNTAAVEVLEFTGNWFKPRNSSDIWNVAFLEGGYYGLPDNVKVIYPGQEYIFGCVSVKGPVSFKVSYVEYENDKDRLTNVKQPIQNNSKPPGKTLKPTPKPNTKPTIKPTASPTPKPTVKPTIKSTPATKPTA
ncbi:hypothetical protein ACTFIV_001610 [Dictyostelium citrinum]